MPTNKQRAAWAAESLKVFTLLTYGGQVPKTMPQGDIETAVQDLITDLLHYWQKKRKVKPRKTATRPGGYIDPMPYDLLMRAYRNYEHEIKNPKE